MKKHFVLDFHDERSGEIRQLHHNGHGAVRGYARMCSTGAQRCSRRLRTDPTVVCQVYVVP